MIMEKVLLVIMWMALLLFVIGPGPITLLGGLDWVGSNRDIYWRLPTVFQKSIYAYVQYLLYTLDSLTTANFSELKPRTDAIRLVSGALAMVGIFLVGLLGFVAGNRIRNS